MMKLLKLRRCRRRRCTAVCSSSKDFINYYETCLNYHKTCRNDQAALHGRVLILEGIEKAERNLLPVLNNLLENREMALEVRSRR